MTIEERNKLVEDNYQLLLYFYSKYRAKYRMLDAEDVRSMVEDGFLDACGTFDREKGALAHWVNLSIKKKFYVRSVGDSRIKASKYETVSYDDVCKPTSRGKYNWSEDGEVAVIDENAQNEVESCVGNDFVEWCLEGLTDIQREAVVRVCLNGEGLSTIAEEKGTTRQAIYCAKEKGLNNIRRKLADEREFQNDFRQHVQNPQ